MTGIKAWEVYYVEYGDIESYGIVYAESKGKAITSHPEYRNIGGYIHWKALRCKALDAKDDDPLRGSDHHKYYSGREVECQWCGAFIMGSRGRLVVFDVCGNIFCTEGCQEYYMRNLVIRGDTLETIRR